MKFFDKVLAVLGFESQEKDTEINTKQPKKKAKNPPLNANFNLQTNSHTKRLPATRNISSQDQVSYVLDELKEKGAVIVDLSGFEKNLKIRAYDFICGAVFILNGQIKKMGANKYLCSLDELNDFMED